MTTRKVDTKRISLISVISLAALAACGPEQESEPAADDAGASSCTGGSSDNGGASTTGGSSTTGGNSTTGGWAGRGGSGGAECNTLANLGDVVQPVADPAPVPEMTGGAIANGTYVLTSSVHYDGASADPATVKWTMLITDNGRTAQQVRSYDGGPDMRWTIARAPSGNELNSRRVCPEEESPNRNAYTATPDSLTIFAEQAGSNLVITFTRLEPGCVSDGENLLCAPSGFPFVTRTFASTDSCLGSDCIPPNPTLTQPESGTLCMSGTAPALEQAGFPLILFSSTPDFSKILQAFDADALGITDVSFTVDSPPEGGIVVHAGIVRSYTCETLNLCVGFGFDVPRITEAGTVSIPLADFLQSDPASPDQTFDTSSLAHIGFMVGEGPYDFCIRDFKFLNDEGVEVSP